MKIDSLNSQFTSPPLRSSRPSASVHAAGRLDTLEAAAPRDKGISLGQSLKAFALLGLAVGVSACQPESGVEIVEAQQSGQTDASVTDLRADRPDTGTVVNSDGTSSTIIGNTMINSDGTSSTRIGGTVVNSDGSSRTRIGSTILNSDGSSSTRIGDTVLNSDGSSSTRVGNTVLHSDGSSSTRIGNTVLNSDGSSSTRIGNTIINSDGTVSFEHGLGVDHDLWQ